MSAAETQLPLTRAAQSAGRGAEANSYPFNFACVAKYLIIAAAVLVVLLMIGTIIVGPRAMLLHIFARFTAPSQQSCINNLRQIDGASQQWALENHKMTSDVPAWSDIQPYLKGPLSCPQGGTYILGRVQDLPKCSVAGHRLPPRME